MFWPPTLLLINGLFTKTFREKLGLDGFISSLKVHRPLSSGWCGHKTGIRVPLCSVSPFFFPL